ncbi:putative zinc-binding alcohol [Phaeomoniella chlamydospora]|uniref:alcohol dehydrogenase (NADP(+)) n=1 Tax=Phaeomoniella chlamydospora TaxID=158046 RepID=A0A0G2E6T0_PHACM|nr:putative zinc-binding alcohol [Phaeomoniella chlamydospora]
MSSADYNFEGWMGLGKDSAEGKMVWQGYDPKPWEESDVDIKISHCGICGSDLHTLRSGWGPSDYPVVVGHEIVGEAVRVGTDVQGIKVGDRVGVGAQSGSCLRPDCDECSNGVEQHCQNASTTTYNSKWPNGGKAYGGYATYWRGHNHFVIPIPSAIPSEEAAPMLCGGITTYSPLKANGCGPGKRVGIVGIGGLGHFGVLWAKALGADKVVAISRKSEKASDAMKMGADQFIATDEEENWAGRYKNTLDLIVCTVSSPKLPLMDYLSLIDVNGTFIQVGAPEEPFPPFSAFALIAKGVKIGGSMIGSPSEIKEMLALAATKKTKAWVEVRPMKDGNQAIIDMDQGNARYRYVLAN